LRQIQLPRKPLAKQNHAVASLRGVNSWQPASTCGQLEIEMMRLAPFNIDPMIFFAVAHHHQVILKSPDIQAPGYFADGQRMQKLSNQPGFLS
jgi:hypothetical protein